ncbi:branched-chain amino acid ABC transporter permease [Hydrogenophaga sp. 2FB]|uniref:branched-chain amino acid ABC transporter permease n=1 Tax=Hydrogenophaga sp. 2FB TaxID=2502187 RepID=UPI0010F672DE|nr:branched-chain amino acid ABC transporter permease [Hydrogenophaga sp. 2FB]
MKNLRLELIAAVVIGLACAALGRLVSEGAQHFIAQVLIMAIFASAFDLAFGRTGIFSVGHAAFFGIGAYAFAWVAIGTGWGVFPALAASVVAGGLLALLFGVLGRRATGIYFALATLALGQLVSILIEVKMRRFSGGSDGIPGIPRPMVLGIDFSDTLRYLWFTCFVFSAILALIALVRRSPYGHALAAVRDNPVRAEQLGYHVGFYRITALGLSGAISGLSGALFGMLTMFVGPDMLRFMLSGEVLIMAILGGSGTLFGPLLGVTFFEGAREVINGITPHWLGFVGLLFILITLFAPAGLVGILAQLRARFLRRRAAGFWRSRQA